MSDTCKRLPVDLSSVKDKFLLNRVTNLYKLNYLNCASGKDIVDQLNIESAVKLPLMNSQHKQYRRILPDDKDIRAFSDIDFTSLAIFLISSLSLTRPHCWHINPLSSAFQIAKDKNSNFGLLTDHEFVIND